jgi:hypothetical protein
LALSCQSVFVTIKIEFKVFITHFFMLQSRAGPNVIKLFCP